MLHVKRLNYTGSISAMICVASRHACTAEGATQHALDEIVAALHNIDAICARRPALAAMLNGPIPAVPSWPTDEDNDDVDDDIEDDDSDDLDGDIDTADTQSLTHAIAQSSDNLYADMHPGQAKLLRAIRLNPGSTQAELSDITGIGQATINTYLGYLRKAGHPITTARRGRIGAYTLLEQ